MIRILLLIACCAGIQLLPAISMMPLEEVRPGMQGEWKTVVTGNEIRSFSLEIIGVARNFVGPQRSVILARALDEEHIRSGPVAGMSGSPVYIDGRLVGAYAYGYGWSKEQALIGITPIDQMLEVLEYDQPSATVATPTRTGYGSSLQTVSAQAGPARTQSAPPHQGLAETGLQPLPTPLFASGVSRSVLEIFQDEFAQLGLEVMQSPLGAADATFSSELQPGSAVAGVLMAGDFNFAAVGTVTWRDGDHILAFGHPFLSAGALAMPMAEAEILTVIQTLPRSFKLSNVGKVVGSLYQDRLTAVAGEIGRAGETTPVTFNIHTANGSSRTYRGDLFQHRNLSPILAAIALLQSLTQTMEADEEQTIFMQGTLAVNGYSPIEYQKTGVGPSGATSLAIELMRMLSVIMNNPFEVPQMDAIHFDIHLQDTRQLSTLQEIRNLSGSARPGEDYSFDVTLFNLLGEPQRLQVDIPIPDGTSGEVLTVFFGDAQAAESIDLPGRGRDYTSLADIIDDLRGTRSNQYLYIKLLRPAPGLRIEGQNLYDLPPSVANLLSSTRTRINRQVIPNTTVWETSIQLPGAFQGGHTLPLPVQ